MSLEEAIYNTLNNNDNSILSEYTTFFIGDKLMRNQPKRFVIYERETIGSQEGFDFDLSRKLFYIDIQIFETLDYLSAQEELQSVSSEVKRELHQNLFMDEYNDTMKIEKDTPIYEEKEYILKTRRLEVSFLVNKDYSLPNDEFDDIEQNYELI